MSSIIDSIEYDAPSQALTVTFLTGTAYRYEAVPQALVDKVMQKGESLGAMFYKHIRKGEFEFTKVSSAPAVPSGWDSV